MIHEGFKRTEVAKRYYAIVTPNNIYTPEQARKQFWQDPNINWKVLDNVIGTIYQEQKKLINEAKKAKR
jgi:dTDP-4-dehydrorhamnose 3,5-epimerase-like enzyme